ncbi:MAG: 50S ribosomal protein L35 [Patescibacteria group bacterium]|nr:50S ribosomal protein L35 [Patescibacteria group bacterium]
MPKRKSNKALMKKIKISKSGKVKRRSTGQNHFNAKESGNKTRAKRSDKRLFKTDEKNILKALA